jgi:hypothetical protein
MADFDKIAQQITEVAQRIADVSDAARGKGVRIGAGNSFARWLILPARSPTRFERPTEGQAPETAFTAFGDDDRGAYEGRPTGRLNSDGELAVHLRDRAERRERRRESLSS